MKRILTILLSLAALTAVAQKQNWLEALVNNLSSRSDIDRTIAVNRSPSTHEITNATYDFRFSSPNLYRSIMDKVRQHAAEADFFSEENAQDKDKQKVIIMRFTDNGRRWSCRLQPIGNKNKQFLVAITSGDKNTTTVTINGTDFDYSNLQGLSESLKGLDKLMENKSIIIDNAKKMQNRHGKSTVITIQPDGSAAGELEELNAELKRAEQERKRKLSR